MLNEYSAILNSIGDGVVTTDKAGLITSLNRTTQDLTGWNEQEMKGKHFTSLFRPSREGLVKKTDDPTAKALLSGKVIGLANHSVLVDKQGNAIPITGSASSIKDDDGNVHGVVIIFHDMRQEVAPQDQILYLSYHDALTGLYNRRYVMKEAKRLNTSKQMPLSVIIGDVNGLKMTNDAFGHEVGDKLLKKVARTMESSCRKTDMVSRWGGDEFLILLPKTSMEEARAVIRKMRKSLERKSSGVMQLSVSLGYAMKKDKSEKWMDILKEAEKWMYRKKLLEEKSYRSMIITTLLATLYEKSTETEEHSKRLENYCLAIGRKLRLMAEELNELSLLAMLHDIGKIGIHQSILQKPGPLSSEEWEEIRHHPEIGYRIVKNTPELSMVAEYILLHHERWDGKGYPMGYKEKSIPLLCRILAVADAYDVMIQGRVYKLPLSHEEAIAELKRNAGTQFDPQIVDLFIKTICFAV